MGEAQVSAQLNNGLLNRCSLGLIVGGMAAAFPPPLWVTAAG